jgi:anti-sigma factor ChrR (cupin superfamily)
MNSRAEDPPVLPPEIVSAIVTAVEPVPLLATRKTALRARIQSRVAGGQSFVHALGGTEEWRSIGPGVAVKHLRRAANHEAFLIRIDAGCELPPHDHDGDEESVLLAGDAWIDGTYYGQVGDSHLASVGTRHDTIRSPKGCMLYVRVSL